MNRTITALLALTAVATTGCSDTFYTVETSETSGRQSTVTFDSTLPEASEDLFNTCATPLILDRYTTEVDLIDGCVPDDVSGPAQDLFLGAAVVGPAPVSLQLSSDMQSRLSNSYTIDTLAWPFQNCEITIAFEMDMGWITVENLDSEWTTHNTKAALSLDTSLTNDVVVAHGPVTSDIECPSGVSEWVLNAFAGDLPNGHHQVIMNGLDLDFWVTLYPEAGGVGGNLDAYVSATGMRIYPELSSLVQSKAGGNFEYILRNYAGVHLGYIEGELEAQLEADMQGLADDIASAIGSTAPSLHEVCEVYESGGELFIETESYVTPAPARCN